MPPDTSNKVKLILCGKNMVINPATGRCVKLSSPIGKKLTSVPYIIVNPPAKPPKGPLFVPSGPKPKVGPTPKKPMPVTKQEKIRTGLDTDDDGYISIKEYLDTVESIGGKEKASGEFHFYSQSLGISFVLHLIKSQKVQYIILDVFLCLFYVFMNLNGPNKYTTLSNQVDAKGDNLECPIGVPGYVFYAGGKTNMYASIAILNAPLAHNPHLGRKMHILISPKLESIIRKCEDDNKYMVVCDLTLLESEKFAETSHANVLIFDTEEKQLKDLSTWWNRIQRC